MHSIVTDTSPLVALSAIHRLDLLRVQFENVVVPTAVFREVVTNGDGWSEAADAQKLLSESSFFKVQSPVDLEIIQRFRQRLGAGESEALALAIELELSLLVDELKARKAAHALGIAMTGTLGIIARSKHLGHVTKARPLTDALRDAGIYFGDALIGKFLADLGEN